MLARKVHHPFIFLCLCDKQLVNLCPNRLYLDGYQGYAIWGGHHHVSHFCFSKGSLSLWPDGEQAVAISSCPEVNTAVMTVRPSGQRSSLCKNHSVPNEIKVCLKYSICCRLDYVQDWSCLTSVQVSGDSRRRFSGNTQHHLVIWS